MPLTTVRLRANRTQDDLDVIYHSFQFDGPTFTSGDLQELVTNLKTTFDAQSPLATQTFRHTVTLAEAFPGDGGPAYEIATLGAGSIFGTGSSSPPQVQFVVSRDVDGVRGRRPTGRMYWPVSQPVQRPSVSFIQAMGDWMNAFHDSMVADGFTPVVISRFLGGVERPAAVGLPIVGYSMDNAFDTQRRRGHEPTIRTPFTPGI